MAIPGIKFFRSTLEHPLILRIRRNHSLEHATLHVLSRRYPRMSLAGHSNPGGFWIIGDVSTEEMNNAVGEALHRLKIGELNLAIHPNCGTNIAVAGLLAGLAGGLTMLGAGRRLRDRLGRLPLAASMATLALFLARPLGAYLQQQVTTSGELQNLEIVEISHTRLGWLNAHRISTRS